MNEILNYVSDPYISFYSSPNSIFPDPDRLEVLADKLLAIPRLALDRTVISRDQQTNQFQILGAATTWQKALTVALSVLFLPFTAAGIIMANASTTFRSKITGLRTHEQKIRHAAATLTVIGSQAKNENRKRSLEELASDVANLQSSLSELVYHTTRIDPAILKNAIEGLIEKMVAGAELTLDQVALLRQTKGVLRTICFSHVFSQDATLAKTYKKFKDIYHRSLLPQIFLCKIIAAQKAGGTATKLKFHPKRYFSFEGFTASNTSDNQSDRTEDLKKIYKSHLENKEFHTIRWLHGTGSGTLPAMIRSGGQLKCTGALLKENAVSFHGENNQGIGENGVNRSTISGAINTPLGVTTVLYYARGDHYHGEPEISNAARLYPEKFLGILNSQFKEILSCVDSNNFTSFKELCSDICSESSRINYLRAIRIAAVLKPEKFRLELLPIVQRVTELLNRPWNPSANELKETLPLVRGFCNDIQATQLPSSEYDAIENEWIASRFGIVFGSKSISKEKLLLSKKGMYRDVECLCNESLKLGRDLEYVFVPMSRVDAVQAYIKKHLQSEEPAPAVLPIEQLSLGIDLDAYTAKKLQNFS